MAAIRTQRAVAVIHAGEALVPLEVIARHAGVQPEVAYRFVQLGLLEPVGGTRAAPRFHPRDALRLARAARLRRDLGLNYAGAVLASELLERIDELERQLRIGWPHPDHTR
jgi:chaperone modulatory protein CbpM